VPGADALAEHVRDLQQALELHPPKSLALGGVEQLDDADRLSGRRGPDPQGRADEIPCVKAGDHVDVALEARVAVGGPHHQPDPAAEHVAHHAPVCGQQGADQRATAALVTALASGDSEALESVRRLPAPAFPGGRWLRRPLTVAGLTWYALRDRL
jgi:hypothetical protein